MKKHFTKAFGVAAALMLFVNCSTDNSSEETATTSDVSTLKTGRYTPEDFEYVGSEHNRILALVLEKQSEQAVPASDFQDFTKYVINDELEKTNATSGDLALATDLVYNNLHKVPDFGTNLYANLPEESLTEPAKAYLDELHSILLEDEAELDAIKANIEVLERAAYEDKDLDNHDLGTIFCATRVASYSISYWTDNLVRWEAALGDMMTAKGKTPGRRAAEIAVADVGGAVGGATYAWAANVFPGIGQATYAGAIVGGAITCSVAAGVYHIAASIFQWD